MGGRQRRPHVHRRLRRSGRFWSPTRRTGARTRSPTTSTATTSSAIPRRPTTGIERLLGVGQLLRGGDDSGGRDQPRGGVRVQHLRLAQLRLLGHDRDLPPEHELHERRRRGENVFAARRSVMGLVVAARASSGPRGEDAGRLEGCAPTAVTTWTRRAPWVSSPRHRRLPAAPPRRGARARPAGRGQGRRRARRRRR